MANIMRRDPYNLDFEDLFRTFFRPLTTQADMAQGETTSIPIKIDVKEEEKKYIVHAEIPGVKKEDIHVSIDGNQVSITAEVKRETEVKGGKEEGVRVLRSERYFGKTYRSFVLPYEIDRETAKAKCENGILELELPKKMTQTAHKLNID